MVKLRINGREVSARPDQTILEVAREQGIYIPTLCYHDRLSWLKSCRVCLVDVEGAEMPMVSCATPVLEGMVVQTETERVRRMRIEAVKFLLVNHPTECPVCDAGGECALQNRVHEFGIEMNEFPREEREIPEIPYGTPLIRQWFDRCVMCLRCIQACVEIPGADVLDVADRGFSSHVEAVRRENCISCGECLHMCPVGALTENLSWIKGRKWQLDRVQSTCPFCACGCQLELNSMARTTLVKVTTKSEPGINLGSLCVLGRFGHDFIHHPDRLKKPLIRRAGVLTETSWEEVLGFVAERLEALKEKYGASSIGGIASSRATNEENYLFQKWMRAGIGTNHIDNGARLSNGASFQGLMAGIGWGAMTHAIDDVARADLILLVGADVYDDHLIFSNKMREAVRNNNARVILVDPRKTKWQEWADLWLRPLPGTDIAWINGLMRMLIEAGAHSETYIRSHVEGFPELKASLDPFTPERVQELTSIPSGSLQLAAELYGRAKKRAIVFGSGVSQHARGSEAVKALCNLGLITGEAEKEGGGIYPMLAQNNGQGAWDMGSLPDFLPGYQSLEDPHVRSRFEEAWGRRIPVQPGLTYSEIFDKVSEGGIRALYVFGEDPFITLPNLVRLKSGLRRLELLVVQDLFLTGMAEYAHVVLPGASFAEKDGTFTSMERRVQRVRAAIEPVGDSRPDWRIFCDLSSRMGYPMQYGAPSEIMDEIGSLVPLYKEAGYSRIEGEGIQWPRADGAKRKFHAVVFQPPAERPDPEYPLWILAGGFHYHYGIGTTTKRAAGLAQVLPETHLRVHPADAVRAGVTDGERVKVISPRAVVETICRISTDIPEGSAYFAVTFFPVPVNELLVSGQEPDHRYPDYKAFAGRIAKQ